MRLIHEIIQYVAIIYFKNTRLYILEDANDMAREHITSYFSTLLPVYVCGIYLFESFLYVLQDASAVGFVMDRNVVICKFIALSKISDCFLYLRSRISNVQDNL